jgi:hypothetical protein
MDSAGGGSWDAVVLIDSAGGGSWDAVVLVDSAGGGSWDAVVLVDSARGWGGDGSRLDSISSRAWGWDYLGRAGLAASGISVVSTVVISVSKGVGGCQAGKSRQSSECGTHFGLLIELTGAIK